MIIFGSKASNIGNFEVQTQNVHIVKMKAHRGFPFLENMHIFWIPFFLWDEKHLQSAPLQKND